MSRSLAPKQVDFVRHQASRAAVPLMFDRNDLTFFVKIGTAKFSGPTAKEVKDKVHAYLERAEAVKVNWRPVIEISLSRRDHFDEGKAAIGLATNRFYLGVHTGGDTPQLLKLSWYDYHRDFKTSIFYRGKTESEINPDLEHLKMADKWWDNNWDGQTEPSFPYQPSGPDGDIIIEYDESSWQGLQAIEKGIFELGKKLDKLLHSKAGRERVKLAGAKKLKLLSF